MNVLNNPFRFAYLHDLRCELSVLKITKNQLKLSSFHGVHTSLIAGSLCEHAHFNQVAQSTTFSHNYDKIVIIILHKLLRVFLVQNVCFSGTLINVREFAAYRKIFMLSIVDRLLQKRTIISFVIAVLAKGLFLFSFINVCTTDNLPRGRILSIVGLTNLKYVMWKKRRQQY